MSLHRLENSSAAAALRLFLNAFRSPAVIVAAALTLRLLLATAWLKQDIFAANEPSHIAAHIANGQGFSSPYNGTPIAPTAQQPPLYPIFLALCFKITGVYSTRSLLLITGLNCIVGSGLCWLIWKVGCRWFSPLAGTFGAWVWALSPDIAMTDLFISNYLFSAAFVLTWLMALPRDCRQMNHGRAAQLGLAIGFGMLLNPMLIVLYAGSLSWLRPNKRQLAVSAACAMLVVTPWVVRNYVEMGNFYPALRDNFGLELYIGNHPGVSSVKIRCPWNLCNGISEYDAAFPEKNATFASMGEAAYMSSLTRQALSDIVREPWQFLKRSAKRALVFWLLPFPEVRLIILALALAGVIRCNTPVRSLIVTMLGIYPVMFYVTQVSWPSSYRHPIEPLLLLAAGHIVAERVMHYRTPHLTF